MLDRIFLVVLGSVIAVLIWILGFGVGKDTCEGAPIVPLKIDKFSVTFAQLTQRDPMIPEIELEQWQMQLATEFDLRVFKYVYWENKIHGETAYSKFMGLGWEYEIGLRPSRYFDLFWQHHSRHSLDIEQPYYYNRLDSQFTRVRYPVRDAYGIRFNFIP